MSQVIMMLNFQKPILKNTLKSWNLHSVSLIKYVKANATMQGQISPSK